MKLKLTVDTESATEVQKAINILLNVQQLKAANAPSAAPTFDPEQTAVELGQWALQHMAIGQPRTLATVFSNVYGSQRFSQLPTAQREALRRTLTEFISKAEKETRVGDRYLRSNHNPVTGFTTFTVLEKKAPQGMREADYVPSVTRAQSQYEQVRDTYTGTQFPPKEQLVNELAALGVIDQFSNKLVTNADWRDVNGEKSGPLDFLYVVLEHEQEGVETVLSVQDNSLA